MKYELAIFDFDGTLADSFPFFVRVFNQLADQHGFKHIDPDQVAGYRHYSPRQIMAHVGLPAWKLPLVANNFIALMRENAAEIALFPEVDTMLQTLADNGVMLAIVSSNAEDNIRSILGEHQAALIRHYECGMSMFGKAPRIRRVLKRSGVAAADALYIGDQGSDGEAARAVGVPFGAVAWGYATLESLLALDPEEVFEQVSDIERIRVPR